MILRFFRFDDPAHRNAAELLPWLVNGTLEGLEREEVDRHVAQCVACRRELEAGRALQAAVASEERDPAVASSLARLRLRLDEEEAGYARGLTRLLARLWREARPAVRRTLAAQFALIVVLASALAIVTATDRPRAALYRTLSDAPLAVSGDAAIVVVFKSASSEREIRQLLLRLNARVVDGPSSVGAYRLEVPEPRQQAALVLLHGDPAVAFAEPVPSQEIYRE